MARAAIMFPINAEGSRICDSAEDADAALRDAYEAVAAAKAWCAAHGPDPTYERLRQPKSQLLLLLNTLGIKPGGYNDDGGATWRR